MFENAKSVNVYRLMIFVCALTAFAITANGQFKPCEDKTGQGQVIASETPAKSKPLKIFELPRAVFTEAAREKGVHGTVTLKVRFLAGGSIGNIFVVEGLPEGLTEAAIKAAKKIRFLPARQNGRMVNVAEIVEYEFHEPGTCVAERKKPDN